MLVKVTCMPGAIRVLSAVKSDLGRLLLGQSIVTVAPVPSVKARFTGMTSKSDLLVSSVLGRVLI